MSSEFVTCEPALSLTLAIGENEGLTAWSDGYLALD